MPSRIADALADQYRLENRDHDYSVTPDGNAFAMLQSVVGSQQALGNP